ncbi:hypothetical protein JYK14_04335 [Siccirubricoccus sp. KC 17139]|uniref:Uncharacterized protein n=1 Tax=Siccirubricoccus soli TaxID=2899147 RepID=A0ABT1D275_9PROT|nr:hypothetical protein [Siccirubricoccus soli]MCO6415405.1 hypothetical protein [Siccirubricoccus soli]MCP2681537.1 hypothetical protein [Siccirubricoccus soli]
MASSAAARARQFRNWMWLGAAAGFANGLYGAKAAWAGNGIAANLGEALGGALVAGLLARAVCWVWLKRQDP